MEKKCCVVSL